MPLTPWVFCAVSAVMTEAPKTPSAAKVFRSAWMPAPPDESEPALVSAIGVAIAGLLQVVGSGPWIGLTRRAVTIKPTCKPTCHGALIRALLMPTHRPRRRQARLR